MQGLLQLLLSLALTSHTGKSLNFITDAASFIFISKTFFFSVRMLQVEEVQVAV